MPERSDPYRVRWVRKTIITLEGLVAVSGLVGAAQLWTGAYVPPISALEPLGLASWQLPALWLFATVAVPSAVAAWLAWRGSPHTPAAVLVSAAALVVELIVQIPFVGPERLQVVFGAIAVSLAVIALSTRSRWAVAYRTAAEDRAGARSQ